MKARLVVFPIKGRNWCFSRSIDAVSGAGSSSPPPTLRDFWGRISAGGHSTQDRAEIAIDFFADRVESLDRRIRAIHAVFMNRGWIGLEKAPEGSLKSKIHSLGLRLLSRVKPSEIFLKSVSKDVTKVEVTYPASLNPRLVRRRLRHIAVRGSAIHRNYFYGSVSLLPITTLLSVLPLPNVPFFWVLFRTYSHWSALKGSERLMLLVSDCTKSQDSFAIDEKENGFMDCSNNTKENVLHSPWVLKPSEELQRLLDEGSVDDGLSCSTISSICKAYDLEKKDVLKYKNSQ